MVGKLGGGGGNQTLSSNVFELGDAKTVARLRRQAQRIKRNTLTKTSLSHRLVPKSHLS